MHLLGKTNGKPAEEQCLLVAAFLFIEMSAMPEGVRSCTGITNRLGGLTALFERFGGHHAKAVAAARRQMATEGGIAQADRNKTVRLVMRIGKRSYMDQGVIEQIFGFQPLIRPDRDLAQINRRDRSQYFQMGSLCQTTSLLE